MKLSIFFALILALPLFAADGDFSKFKVKSKDKFGVMREYFTGYVPPTAHELLHRPVREFSPKLGAHAFEELPKEYVLKGNVQRIFSQECGDCWAQGASTAFETLVSLADKASIFVSRQQVIDCSGFGGCGGGQISVKDFVKPKGAVYESDYPYKGSNGKCKTAPRHQAAQDFFYMKDDATWPDYQRAVYEMGPLEVCGASSALKNGGWVSSNPGGGIDHCYALVGWYDGAMHGKPAGSYAIIANSWGSNWGDDGFGYYLMAKDGIHMNGNVIVEGGGFVYKPECDPQPVAAAGPDKSILVGGL